MIEATPPRIVGLDRLVCDFTTRVDGKLFKPIHTAKEHNVVTTALVTFQCFMREKVYQDMGLPPGELGTRIFNYVQPKMPTVSPFSRDRVQFGYQIVLTDDDGNELPQERQPLLAPPAAQLTEGEHANRED